MVLYILIGAFGLGLILFIVFMIVRAKRLRRLRECKKYDNKKIKECPSAFLWQKLIFWCNLLFLEKKVQGMIRQNGQGNNGAMILMVGMNQDINSIPRLQGAGLNAILTV